MLKLILFVLCLTTLSFAKTRDIVLTEENSISFNQPFSSAYVSKKQLEVLQKSLKLPNHKPLFIVLDTPGGSVSAGLSFIDTIKSLDRNVHTITLFAASMGYQVVQELGIRYITPSGELMSHRGAISGLSGQVPGELNSRLNHIQQILHDMNLRASKRVGMSVEKYQNLIINEYWVSGSHAVEQKHADFVANVSCDKKLIQGVNIEKIFTPFGEISVKFSKCPLISLPIGVEYSNTMNIAQKTLATQFLFNRKKRVDLEM